MADYRLWKRSDQSPAWPAWCASLIVHAGLFIALAYLIRHEALRGAAQESVGEAGIVLKLDAAEVVASERELEATNVFDATTENYDLTEPLSSDAETSDSQDPPLASTPGVSPSEEPEAATSNDRSDEQASSLAASEQVKVQVFGAEGTGTRFVYLFDRSVSMEGPSLQAAKRELLASIAKLNNNHQFQIIFFNHEPDVWGLAGGRNRLVSASVVNKRLAAKYLRGIRAVGGTYRDVALQLALNLQPDVVFFLTDTDDPMPAETIANAIAVAARGNTSICTIEFGAYTPPRNNFLTQLARESGGNYVYVDTTNFGN